MKDKCEYIEIGGTSIVIKGIGRAFYSGGFPIALGIDNAIKLGYEVSMFHLADELLKNGWSAKTVIRKLKEEKDLDINGNMNMEGVEEFCMKEYEEQRAMIFDYLWKGREGEIEKVFEELTEDLNEGSVL